MTTRISSTELRNRVLREGIPDRVIAHRALRSTLGALGACLTDDEARALTATLPEELARLVDRSEHRGDLDTAGFYEHVRRRERTPPGVAREHADVVLRALGETLDPEVRARLVRALPDRLAQDFFPRDLGEPPPHPAPRRAPAQSTLARGRPGSKHPIAEAAPPAGHAHSIAQNADPHEEAKLSSARGLTQERLGESLATARPERNS